jgi:tetratricopeptide (TPR) repeat protein
MTRGLLTRSVYSPGNLTPEALEALFVGRGKMLDGVLERLSSSITGEEKHFILLIGPRGIGKTHFVALAHHRLTHDARYREARDNAIIAYLSEEEWGVASFLDLLLRILSALGDGPDERPDQAALAAIYETYQHDPQAAEQLAHEELIRVVGDRTLLLICENLHDLFQGLGTEGQQRWRAFIQEHPFWTILATAPRLFSGVQLRTSPFYGFFTIRPLDTLDFDGALSLLRQRARFEGKKELADFLDTPTGRARVRAIHHLAGGNHRVYVVMAEFLDHESLNELLDPFMGMVDDLTPYYQEKMRQLSPQQRKIVEFLTWEQRPVMVKQIAVRCLMSPQTAAKQVGQLAEYGFVDRHRVGRETYCELAEPLMRICIEVKDTRTSYLRLFVDFLRYWFSSSELKNRLGALSLEQPGPHLLDMVHLRAALHESTLDSREPFLEALSVEQQRCLKTNDLEGLAEASARLAAERGMPEHHFLYVHALRELGRYEEALQVALENVAKHPHRLLLFEKALIHAKLGEHEKSLEGVEHAINWFEGKSVPMYGGIVSYYMLGIHECLAEAGIQFPGAIVDHVVESLKPLREAKEDALWMIVGGVQMLMRLGKWNAARELNAHALSLDPTNILSRLSQVIVLFANGKVNDAVEAAEWVRDSKIPEHHEPIVGGIRVMANTGARGLSEGTKLLRDWMMERSDITNGVLRPVIQVMLVIEVEFHGAVAMARQVGPLRSLLEEHAMTGVLGSALTTMIGFQRDLSGFRNPEWPIALPMLQDALGDMEECKLPLQVLSVAVRYAASGDETVLLELPRELRSLLAQDAQQVE